MAKSAALVAGKVAMRLMHRLPLRSSNKTLPCLDVFAQDGPEARELSSFITELEKYVGRDAKSEPASGLPYFMEKIEEVKVTIAILVKIVTRSPHS